MKNKKKIKAVIIFILMFTLIWPSSVMAATKGNSNSKSKNYITIGGYVKLLVQELEVKPKKDTIPGYVDAAAAKGILLKKNEFKNYYSKITREQCALLTQRTCELANGVDYNPTACEKVKTLKRISDIKKVDKKYQDAVIKVFSNGVIIGYTDGKYTHTRTFKPKSKITVSGAKLIVNRIKNKKKRSPMTLDGQLIRTTNLPVNAKEYEYILASFPNEYYEMKFFFELGKCNNNLLKTGTVYKPVDVKNIAYRTMNYKGTVDEEQEMIRLYGQDWGDKVLEHVKTLFNVNYKTIDSKWAKKLANTYYARNNEDYQKIYSHINGYIKEMKKNHVVCETSKVALDLSSMYYDSGYRIRVYVRYRMKADDMSNTSVIIYDRSGSSTFTETKKWVWKDCCFDISIGAMDGSRGDDYGVTNFFLVDCAYILKTKILKPVYDKNTKMYEFK